MSYSDLAKKTYGHKCEWIGCGWDAGTCDVHHINYQQQQALEEALRVAHKNQLLSMIELYERERIKMGFEPFNVKTMQLPKDDGTHNLTVLCPNHHRYLHSEDLGMEILKYIPARK